MVNTLKKSVKVIETNEETFELDSVSWKTRQVIYTTFYSVYVSAIAYLQVGVYE